MKRLKASTLKCVKVGICCFAFYIFTTTQRPLYAECKCFLVLQFRVKKYLIIHDFWSPKNSHRFGASRPPKRPFDFPRFSINNRKESVESSMKCWNLWWNAEQLRHPMGKRNFNFRSEREEKFNDTEIFNIRKFIRKWYSTNLNQQGFSL